MKAVLIIDMQDFFLAKFQPERKERLILNQLKVVDICITRNIPIIVIEFKDRGETIASLSNSLKSVSTTFVITKEFNSGFRGTNLDEILRQRQVEEIVLMGINASGCVQDTAISALKRGFKIVTSAEVIASATERDKDLDTSRKWYPKKGIFLDNTEELIQFLNR
jgi:nicotinamidase-related amidase